MDSGSLGDQFIFFFWILGVCCACWVLGVWSGAGGGAQRAHGFDYKSCGRDAWRHSSVQEPQQPPTQQIPKAKMFAVSGKDKKIK